MIPQHAMLESLFLIVNFLSIDVDIYRPSRGE